MLGFRSIAGTGIGVYATIAFTVSDSLWITRASMDTLHQTFIVWMLAAAFVGVINWIFD